ncbi:MAG: cytochrome c biogenesis protein ResB [Gemmataceae bacterium]
MSKKSRGRTAVTERRPAPHRPLPPIEAKPAAAPAARPAAAPRSFVGRAVHFLASLELTVALLLLCMGLVLFGTLAQVGSGVWTVVHNYFRSFFVWVPLQIFAHPTVRVPGGFPYPGGWTLGTLLLLNLVAAHASRFQLRWRKAGMWLIHSGIIIMMLGELMTGLFATESRMIIKEGYSSNFIEDHRKPELVLIDISNPSTDRVISVPASRLKHEGQRISDPSLPVDFEVVKYMVNSKLRMERPSSATNLATLGIGLNVAFDEMAEGAGVDQDQSEDIPSAYVRLIDKASGKDLGVLLLTTYGQLLTDPTIRFEDRKVALKNQLITVGDKRFEIALRLERSYLPYTMHLQKFTHDVYPGTTTPKDFRSHVRIDDPEQGVNRDVEIFMNSPLVYRGKTFYQSGVLPSDMGTKGTILQVVHNPGWFMPYLSCCLVATGMLFHFGLALRRFLSSKPIRVEGGVA